MRKLEDISKDIERCQAQIASTYNASLLNNEDRQITREGFQRQLHKLHEERTEYIQQIKVKDSKVITTNECRTSFCNLLKSKKSSSKRTHFTIPSNQFS